MKNNLLVIILSLFCICSLAQNSNWADKNPFEQNVFVENKGQIDKEQTEGTAILFSARIKGIDLYFTAKGMKWKYDEHYLPRGLEKETEPEELLSKMRIRHHYLNMEWQGASSSLAVTAENKVSFYYTYPSRDHHSTLISSCFKKIKYSNLYPGIDAEYVLPEKGGIKYNLVVHPGGDLSKVKASYKGAQTITQDKDGNILIETSFGLTFMEHSPQSYSSDNSLVPSSFVLEKKQFGFGADYDRTQPLTIDPWVSIVSFPNTGYTYANTAYDVEYDNNGNVWVYGGDYPLHLAKYNSGGNLLWVYNSALSAGVTGDFTVNKTSGTAYITEGWSSTLAAQIEKVNTAGALVTTFPGSTGASELSRIRLDCSGNLFLTGGGVPAGSWQVATIDTNLTSMTGTHITASPNGDHDLNLMTLDPAGSFMYVNFNYPAPYSPDSSESNEMQKVPIPAFTPTTWKDAGPTFSFVELGSLYYSGNFNGSAYARLNMFNGMVCGSSFLYTYNGDTLKQYTKNTGALVAQVVTGGQRNVTGGIDLDLCENVYVSVGNAVEVYNPSLAKIKTYALPYTTCYDLKVNTKKNVLVACGDAYVCEIAISAPTILYTLSSVPSSGCSCNGSASVVVNPSCPLPSIKYNWAPGGQTSSSLSGMCSGNYTVTVSTARQCGVKNDTTFTFNLTGGAGSLNITPSAVNLKCFGDNSGAASIKAAGGTGAYTYNWSNGQKAATANNLAAGTYTVTVNDAGGCSNSTTIALTQPPLLTLTATGLSTTCNGLCNGQAVLIPAGGTAPIGATWSTSGTGLSISNLCAGNYSVTLTDANNCHKDSSVIVNSPSAITLVSSALPAKCNQKDGSVSVSAAGGTPALSGYSYNWSNGASSSTVNAIGAGVYTVTVSDKNNCTVTTSATVSTINGVTASTAGIPVACFGASTGSASATASGGSGPYAYTWSNSPTTQANLNLPQGTYTVTITDKNACTSTSSVTITQPPALVVPALNPVSLCQGQTVKLSVNPSGGTPAYSMIWNPGGQTGTTIALKPLNTSTYTVAVTDANGCLNQQTVLLTVNPVPVIHFIGDKLSGCETLCVNFTDKSSAVPDNITAWSWSFADGNTSVTQNPKECFSKSGTYSVILKATSDKGCSTTDSVHNMITVYPTPHAAFSVNPTVATMEDPVFYYTNQSTGATSWLWNFGDSLDRMISTVENPTHKYSQQGSYCTKLIVSNPEACVDSTTLCVDIEPDFAFFVPNAFTPNGNGTNDEFNGKGIGIKQYRMFIFDRWGNLIFTSNDLGTGWNGKANGGDAVAQQDVYVYEIELTDIFNRLHNYVGQVTLVR